MKIHKADIRLRNNGGINYPVCKIDEPLDMEHGCIVVNDMEQVTCEKCKKDYVACYPWTQLEK